ncbi:hypothetical protein HELRODRAFT_167586 [Helobdella robusta]|uniref:Uncharacterized protein n=1 Tax=Helobdella robusta TaxID=6412 RepID=T1EZI8_HELRO|nr:hypothetical protein HELRODRAFT_167586 [Helobdella robusta]ESO11063.1 hypothetical protein HELRODRAFT_167586 [Helobdella robusta]
METELSNFAEKTSIRGIPKFFRASDIFLKLLWLFTVLASTTFTIFLLYESIGKFISMPVTTSFGEKVDQKITFPDITLCNLDPFAEGKPKELTFKEFFNLIDSGKNMVIEEISSINKLRKDNSFKTFDADGIINEFQSSSGYMLNLRKDRPKSEDCPHFIVECSFFDYDWFKMDNPCSSENFTRRWNANYYTCYTLKTSTLQIDNSTVVRGLTLLLNIGPPNYNQLPYKSSLTNSQARRVVVSVHLPGTAPDLKRGFTLAPELYNSNVCTEYCQQQLMQTNCGCMTHLFSLPDENIDEIEMCGNLSVSQTETEETSLERSIKQFICSAVNISQENVEYCKKECLLPCNELTFETLLSTATWPQPSIQMDLFNKFFNVCMDSHAKVRARYINYFSYNLQNQELFAEYDSSNRFNGFSFSNLTQIQESLLQIKFVINQNYLYYQSESFTYNWQLMTGSI